MVRRGIRTATIPNATIPAYSSSIEQGFFPGEVVSLKAAFQTARAV
jgi:hypothetical protein